MFAGVGMLFTSQVLAQAQRPLPADATRPRSSDVEIQPRDQNANPGPTGQARPGTSTRVTVNRPVTGGGNMNPDQMIASMLAIGNAEEIEMAKLAQSKTENKDVREFADTMIKDHTKFLNKLIQTGAAEPQLHANSVREENTAASSNTGTASATSSASGSERSVDPVTMKREIAQQCLAMAQKKAAETKGEHEFNMCYIGQQLVAHEQMLAALKVAHRHVSRDLQSTIEEGEKTTEEHLEHAEKLVKQLAQNDRSSSSGNSDRGSSSNRKSD